MLADSEGRGPGDSQSEQIATIIEQRYMKCQMQKIPHLFGLSNIGDNVKNYVDEILKHKQGKMLAIVGAAGVGKTMLLRSIQKHEQMIEYIHVPVPEIISMHKIYDLTKVIQLLFSEAVRHHPAVIVFDEMEMFDIDPLLMPRIRESMHEHPEVPIIATANKAVPMESWPAIGHMQIIPMPNAAAREQILEFHLNGQLNVEEAVMKTEGYTPADLIQLARDTKYQPVRKLISQNPKLIERPQEIAEHLLVPSSEDLAAALKNSRPSYSFQSSQSLYQEFEKQKQKLNCSGNDSWQL